MRLIPHPDYPHPATTGIEAEAVRTAAGLRLRYSVSGMIDQLRLPEPAAPVHTDELWKHTCFEAFIWPAESDGYLEFNFSPSTQWAAYRFASWRRGMRPIGEIAAPEILLKTSGVQIIVDVALVLPALPDLPPDEPWRMALTTIIEDANGAKSFWSLAHPQGKPDFHHADNFALTLPAEPS